MSDWGRDTPPEASSGVFVSNGSMKTDADPEKVWSILLDFKSYREWCVIEFYHSDLWTHRTDQEPFCVCLLLLEYLFVLSLYLL